MVSKTTVLHTIHILRTKCLRYKNSTSTLSDREIDAMLMAYTWGLRDTPGEGLNWQLVGQSIRLILNYGDVISDDTCRVSN